MGVHSSLSGGEAYGTRPSASSDRDCFVTARVARALRPYDVYKRVFGDTILPGGDADAKATALARLRTRRETVLAQVTADLVRVKKQFPASFRPDLEAHEAAVRELEVQLDRVPGNGPGCSPPVLPQGLPVNDTNNLKTLRIAEAQFAIVQAAFACDFTRMVTFMWGTGASALSFPELGIGNHHAASHDDNAGASERGWRRCRRWCCGHDRASGACRLRGNCRRRWCERVERLNRLRRSRRVRRSRGPGSKQLRVFSAHGAKRRGRWIVCCSSPKRLTTWAHRRPRGSR